MRDDIINQLSKLAERKEDIRILNVFKGVPVADRASLLRVDPDSIEVRTTQFQLVCLYRERKTYIQHPSLPYIVSAWVIDMDIATLRAVLAQFQGVTRPIGERKQVRVQTEDPIQGQVYTPGMGAAFQAELADISNDGLAIYIPHRSFHTTVYYPGVKIRITLKLPGDHIPDRGSQTGTLTDTQSPMQRFSRDTLRRTTTGSGASSLGPTGSLGRSVSFPEVQVRAEIANIVEEPNKARVRVGLRILPGDPSRSIIQKFISQRQAEIIRELQMVYQLLREESSDS